MKIILVILFTSLKSVSSLECVRCFGSDEKSCKPTIEKCSTNSFQNPVCVTLTYSEELNKDKIVHMMEKKCVEASHCLTKLCTRFWTNCRPRCCTHDLCNNAIIKEPEINQKSKRRTSDESSLSTVLFANFSLLFIATVTIVIFQ